VNDSFGHLMGDQVLAAMASRIEMFAQDEHAVAGRLGGDEFALIGNVDTDWDALATQLGQTLNVDNRHFQLGASVGVALADPDGVCSAEDVLRAADHALFAVKRSGGGRAETALAAVVPSRPGS